jgi:subtilisin family serine protease
MNKRFGLLLLLAFCCLTSGRAQSTAQASAPVRLLVRLQEPLAGETSPAARPGESPAAQRFEQLNRRYAAEQVQELNPGKLRSKGDTEAPAMYLIVLPTGTDAERAVRDYEQTGLFRYVELDGQGQGGGALSVVPNDALYGRQWHLKNNGTFPLASARPGADIRMEDAWAITPGDSTLTVAIIDSGCKLDHPEFAGRIWRNRREIPGNGLDDDGNGYVDDVAGWNFVAANNNPVDDHGHGTNVTSILGATGNNGLGFAGVDWRCKLMVCKGLNAQNNGFYSWWISGIYYAVGNGARVINMSLGGLSPSQAMQDAVAFANQRGVVVAACMMNNNNAVVNYPAGLTGVIGVGATNPDDSRAAPFFWSATSGSNFGQHLSVVAPGNYIYGLNHLSNTNFNSYWGGTSQATPLVAGVASLLLGLRPALSPAQVKTIIESSADDLVGNPAEDALGWDPYYGHGRLNAARALAAVVSSSKSTPGAAPAFRLFPNPAQGSVTLHLADARLLRHSVQVFNSLGQLVSQHPLTGFTQQMPLHLAAGAYWVTVAGSPGGLRLLVE